MTKILFGTSGWSYREWIGPFYRKGEKSMLKAHSKIFPTAEINSTFYAYPSRGTVMGWVKYSPEDHVFSAKLPKLVTHDKKLNLEEGVEEDLNRFCDLIRPLLLNGKLGCLLIQLPPRYSFNPEHLEKFFQVLPSEFRFAVEFRHTSWMRPETWELLKKHDVAYTIVDEPLLPPETHVTTDFTYFRWHGHGTRPWFNYRYSREELQPWVPKVTEVASKVKKVYGYFNNHFHGYAVENCLQIMEMLGTLTPSQAEAKARVENHFKLKNAETPTLETFVQPETPSTLNLLHAFLDSARWKRAQQIADKDLTIEEEADDFVRASVRSYSVHLDLGDRVIRHNCADWTRVSPSKRFCKHVGKLFMSLERERAQAILKNIHNNLEKWEFKLYDE